MNIRQILLFLLLLTFAGCLYDTYGNDPYRNDPYRGGYYDRYDDNYYRDRSRRRELEREEDRLRYEREKLERERERLDKRKKHKETHHTVVKPADTCPRGFRKRSSKCSKKERKRGCKDTRSSSGASICVSGV